MENLLKKHFPLIREREEVLRDIRGKQELQIMFEGWSRERQDEFLDFCTGNVIQRIYCSASTGV